jgi:hypothetical protein
MKEKSKTIIVEKNGQRVSITPDHKNKAGVVYKSYRIRTTILGERVTQTSNTLEGAQEKANTLLAQVKAKGGIIATYSPQQVAIIESALEVVSKAKVSLIKAVNDYADAIQHLPTGVSLVEAVRGYVTYSKKIATPVISVAALVEKYKESIKDTIPAHQFAVAIRLDRAAKFFSCNVSDITAEGVDRWLSSLEQVVKVDGKEKRIKLSPLTRNHHRTTLSALLRFAQMRDYLPGGLTAVDKVKPAKKQEKPIQAYTPAEAYYLLTKIEERWKPYVALGLFSGIRPQELLRLDWSDIKRDHIEVMGMDSKVGIRRIVPLLPVLSAWINPHRKEKGSIAPEFKGGDTSRQQSLSKAMRDAVAKARKTAMDANATPEQKALGKMSVIFDGLRHSFISYRVAVVKDLAQVAFEAGNSVEVIQRHYNKRATEAEAKRFFSLTPKAS